MRINPITTIRRPMAFAAWLCCCVCSLCLCSAPALAGGGVLFVDDDAPANGNGETWDTAYQFLQDALAFASDPGNGVGEIRVAQGTYQPDRDETNPAGTGDRQATFELVTDLALMGGYAGIGANDPDERDVDLYETILSGDLLENDEPGFGNYDENSFNICFSPGLDIGEFLIVDGFLFMGGNATGNRSPFWAGGGLRLDESEFESLLSVANCTFVANQALAGGAVSTNDGKVEFSDCLFADNRSIDDEGGAVRGSDTIVEFRRCVLEDNTSATRGGAVYLFSPNGDTLITECSFERNISGWNGGGLHIGFANPIHRAVIRDCLFRHNESTSDQTSLGTGGGLYVDDLPMELVNTAFIENSATSDGAGAYLELAGLAQIIGCQFVGNSTGPKYGHGGGLYLRDGDHVVANCLFAGNSAARLGGGLVFADSAGNRSVVNCTFVANTAGEEGGGLWMYPEDRVFNSIFWLNSDALGDGENSQVFTAGATDVIFYSCIDGWTGALGGEGNHGEDPLFTDIDGEDDIIGTEDDDLTLLSGSPCVDAADNESVPADATDTDDDGNTFEVLPLDLPLRPRFLDDLATKDGGNGLAPIVDMGAIETGEVADPVEYVGPRGGSWFDRSNWEDNEIPDENTDLIISTEVLVDAFGALARDIEVAADGAIAIAAGSLNARDITIVDGGRIELMLSESSLEVRGLNVKQGGAVQWIAGAIRIDGGVWNSPESIEVGCTGQATLELAAGGHVLAPSVQICFDGALTGNGTVVATTVNDGVISPGASTGVITIDGDYLQGDTGTLVIELDGYLPGEQFDAITVTGTADLDGTLDISLSRDFLHQVGSRQTIISAESVIFGFEVINIPSLPGITEFVLELTESDVSLFTMLTETEPRLYASASAPDGGDGQSWDSPIRLLQGPLEVAEYFPGQVAEVWVAAGVYLPSKRLDPPDPRSVTFDLPEGLALYGGFAGDEMEIEKRDPVANPTELNGDLNGDDAPEFENRLDNAYAVVTLEGSTQDDVVLFDGFIVVAGHNTNEHGSGDAGGGLRNDAAPIIIRNCTFTDNLASDGGGGASLDSPGSIVESSSFHNNFTWGNGGGLLARGDHGDGTIIRNCVFNANTARSEGGGLAFIMDTGAVESCLVTNNTADDHGGGAYVSSNAVVEDCVFAGNQTDDEGGGIYFLTADGMIANCLIVGNEAEDWGGGLLMMGDGSGSVVNCLINGNTAVGRDGGGVSVFSEKGLTLINCTITSNFAGRDGGGVATRLDDSVARMISCVIWNNADGKNKGELAQINGPGSVQIDYSCVQGWSGVFGGVGNIGGDPVFVDLDGLDDAPGNDDDDLRLSSGSPCIDAADNSAVPPDEFDLDEDGDTDEPLPFDLDGNPRFVDDPATKDTGNGKPPIVDMGAYEFQSVSCPWDLDGDDNVGTGDLIVLLGSWGDPYGTADLIELLGAWGPCPK